MPLSDKYALKTPAYNKVFSNPDLKLKEGMFFLIAKKNIDQIPRIGITIKKSDFKLAVERNALKRTIKVSFKSVSHKLPAFDYVIIVKGYKTDKEQNKERLNELWKKCINVSK